MEREEEERKGLGRKRDLYCGGRERLELSSGLPQALQKKKKEKRKKANDRENYDLI